VQRTPSVYTLISLTVIVVFACSVLTTSAPNIFPTTMRDVHGMVGEYFEAAAGIVVLVLLST
jgi:Cu+-exporting ATPase